MALFAYECLRKMNRVLRKLEVVLGPDTSGMLKIIHKIVPFTDALLSGYNNSLFP